MSDEVIDFLTEDIGECPPKRYAVPILIILIASIGIVANSIVIFIVITLKEYQNCATNIYVLQLAIADFIFVFQLFFQARTMLLGKWIYGVTWCKISEGIKMMNCYASIMFLTMMSVDRYMAINHAMNPKVKIIRSKKIACIISAIVWIASTASIVNILVYAGFDGCHCQIFFPHEGGKISLDIPYEDYTSGDGYGNATEHLMLEENNTSFLNGIIPPYLEDNACSFDQPHVSTYFKKWLTWNFVAAFLFPLFIISLSYAFIIKRVTKPRTTAGSNSNNTRKRVTILVVGLVVAFTVCWLPYHAFNLARLNGIRLGVETCDNITNFTIVFAYSNSAVNPLFYTFFTTSFRNRWDNAVQKTKRGIRQSVYIHSDDYKAGVSAHERKNSSSIKYAVKKGRHQSLQMRKEASQRRTGQPRDYAHRVTTL